MDRPYFSIVMSIFNQEEWLEESFESLAQQDIGFSDHVQVILVNDGSQDGSLELCRGIEARFPANVIVVDQENQGLSAARNNGLKYVRGSLVNFFDPDDTLPVNVFSEVWKFWHRHKDLPFVTIPLYLTGTKTGLHGKYEHLPEVNSVIDLTEHPENFILSSAASFYPAESLQGRSFDESMLGAEDSLFNFEIFATNPKFGYVCEEGVRYNYTQHHAGVNQVARSVKTASGFVSAVNLFERLLPDEKSEVSPLLKELIIYELRQRVRRIRAAYFESESAYQEVIDRYRDFIDFLDPITVVGSPWSDGDLARHYTFSSSLFRHKPWSLNADGEVADRGHPIFHISTLPIQVRRVNLQPEAVELETVLFDYFMEDFDVVCVSDTGEVHSADEMNIGVNEFGKRVGDLDATRVQYRRFKLPLPSKESRWYFAFRDKSSRLFQAKNVKQWGESPFRAYDVTNKAIATNYWLRYVSSERVFWIHRTKTSTFAYNLRSTLRLIKAKGKILPERLFVTPQKNVILIADRPSFGDDNGEALFRYIQANRPELKKHTWFILSKQAPAYAELRSTNRLVTPGSFKHKVLYLNTRILFSSHLTPEFFSPWRRGAMAEYADVSNRTFVWMQHGVTKDAIGWAFNRLVRANDMIAVATNHEVEFGHREGSLHDEVSVPSCGFPRFDLLADSSADEVTKTILYAPTWRKWLTGRIQPDGTHARVEGFIDSDFYQRHRAILTDPDVLRELSEKNAKINLLLHPGMAEYLDEYEELASDRVIVSRPGSVAYRDALNSSSAMITDYSSVFFDFVYMRKPVIFDQADREEFRAGHYAEGVFDYDLDAPGPISRSPEELKSNLLNLIERGFTMEDVYEDRLKKIFVHDDHDNSKRTLDAAIRVDERRRGTNKISK